MKRIATAATILAAALAAGPSRASGLPARDGFREAYFLTMPNGEYIEAEGELWPDLATCVGFLDAHIRVMSDEVEAAYRDSGSGIFEKVLGACRYEEGGDREGR